VCVCVYVQTRHESKKEERGRRMEKKVSLARRTFMTMERGFGQRLCPEISIRSLGKGGQEEECKEREERNRIEDIIE
jgi:hypothetical protein